MKGLHVQLLLIIANNYNTSICTSTMFQSSYCKKKMKQYSLVAVLVEVIKIRT